MIIKLKEGYLVELNNIKIARIFKTMGNTFEVEISYFDENKNPKSYIRCDSEEEGNQLIDKLLLEITNSRKIKCY